MPPLCSKSLVHLKFQVLISGKQKKISNSHIKVCLLFRLKRYGITDKAQSAAIIIIIMRIYIAILQEIFAHSALHKSYIYINNHVE